MSRSRSTTVGIALATILIAAATIAVLAPRTSAEQPTPPRNVVSTNAILDMFTWYNLEYELRVAPNGTLGVAGSYLKLDDNNDTYKSVGVFFRYYPQNLAPGGFFFGGRLGSYGVDTKDEGKTTSHTAFGFGIDIGYSWLIGPTQRFALSLGIGAVRLFGGDLNDTGAATTLPTVRLVNVGIAF